MTKMHKKEQLLNLGNRFLKANKKASRLQKEFEKLLLEHCGLEEMPGMASDVLVDLDCYGAGSMTEKELGQIIEELKRAAEQEQ